MVTPQNKTNTDKILRVLCLGDVVGRLGRNIIKERVHELRRKRGIDLVIANAENCAGGLGPAPKELEELRAAGVDVFTLGDHTWQHKEMIPYLAQYPINCVRPANLAGTTPGRGSTVLEVKGVQIGIFNLMGRVFSPNLLDCPFRKADEILSIELRECKVKICDFHAEATSEKNALGRYLDGRVSLVFGTHTHVPTADETILPGGTAYVTDLGMCGPKNSVIGMEVEAAVKRFTSGMPVGYQVAKTGESVMGAVICDISLETGKALGIERIHKD